MSAKHRIERLETKSDRDDLRKPTFGEWLARETGNPELRRYRSMYEFAVDHPECFQVGGTT